MSDYWQKFPPVHEAVASYLGMGRREPSAPASDAVPAEDALLGLFRDVVGSGGSVPSDVAEMVLPAVGAN